MLKNNELDYGEVIQIIGPVVDVRFKELHLPNLLTALEIKREEIFLYLYVFSFKASISNALYILLIFCRLSIFLFKSLL